MTLTCILVDLENVQLRVADLAGLSREQHQLKIFHGPSQNKLTIELVRALQPLGDAVEYIQCEKAGPNALDFHLAFHLGRLTVLQPDVQVLIVSRDKGFAQLVSHANRLGHRVSQHAALQAGLFGGKATPATAEPAAAPARKAPARKSVARKTAAAKPVAVATVAQTPEVKPAPERAPARKAAARKTVAAKSPARKSSAVTAPAPEAAPVAAPAPTPAQKPAARKTPARKSTRAAASAAPVAAPVEVAAAPASKPAAKTKSLRDVAGAADRAKAVASLRKMGSKQPVRLKALLHHLQSHLRTDLSPDAIESLVQSLMASGVITLADGKLTYHLAD